MIQPRSFARTDSVITPKNRPLQESPRILSDTLEVPQSEKIRKFLSSFEDLYTLKLDPKLGPIQDEQKCELPPLLKLDSKTRVPHSPITGPISQLPLPESVRGIDASNSETVKRFILSADSIVVDVRPFNTYSTLRVKGSINICIPSTLLKRASFDLAHVINSSTITQALKDVLLERGKHFNIVIYDQASDSSRISIHLYRTIMKFYEGSAFTVSYLDGGFQSVDSVLRDNMHVQTLRSPVSPNFNLPEGVVGLEVSGSRENLPFLTGFTLPSAADPNIKLLDSIKNGLTCIDTNVKYSHQFKFPPNFPQKKNRLPAFFLFIVESYGKDNCSKLIVDHLSERFDRLEVSEQVRLSLAINNSNGIMPNSGCGSLHDSTGYGTPLELCPCCDDIKYTIPKGVEYGCKNRYKNVWPYEHSRVRLKRSPSCRSALYDDYFNANYIHFEEHSETKYIATQNPLEATYEDFWNAVWYNGVQAIVCLDDSSSLYSRRYYEEDNQYKSLSIRIKLVQEYQGYTFRKIAITKRDQVRALYHFAYTDWPDFGTPESSETVFDMIKLKDKVLARNAKENPGITGSSDLLVHCSAGCGRTGCFITLDMVISLLTSKSLKSSLDQWGDEDLIYKSVQFQRQQRISMVQNLGQFIFCYESILNYFAENLA